MTDEEAAQLSRAQHEAALRKAQQAKREAERKKREQQRKAQRQQQYYDEPFGMTDEEAAQLTPAQRRALARRAAQIRRRNGQR